MGGMVGRSCGGVVDAGHSSRQERLEPPRRCPAGPLRGRRRDARDAPAEVGRSGPQRRRQVQGLAVAKDLECDLVTGGEAQDLEVERVVAIDRWPSTAVMMSPASRPASSAGPPSTTASSPSLPGPAPAAPGGTRPGRPVHRSRGRRPHIGTSDVLACLRLGDDRLGQVDGQGEADAVLMPASAVMMPTRLPSPSNRAPPELPEFTAASVWIR